MQALLCFAVAVAAVAVAVAVAAAAVVVVVASAAAAVVAAAVVAAVAVATVCTHHYPMLGAAGLTERLGAKLKSSFGGLLGTQLPQSWSWAHQTILNTVERSPIFRKTTWPEGSSHPPTHTAAVDLQRLTTSPEPTYAPESPELLVCLTTTSSSTTTRATAA